MGPGRTVRVDFSSNKNRATYSCILLDGTTPTPLVTSCKSALLPSLTLNNVKTTFS